MFYFPSFPDLATSRDTDMDRSSSLGSVQAAWSPVEDKLSDWARFKLLLQSIPVTLTAHLQQRQPQRISNSNQCCVKALPFALHSAFNKIGIMLP